MSAGVYLASNVGDNVLASFGRLRSLCRASVNESAQRRSVRMEQQSAEFAELFSFAIAQSREGMRELFRIADIAECKLVDDKWIFSKPLLAPAREYLYRKLVRMQEDMDWHLESADDFEPVLREEMQLIAESEFMLSRPSAMKPITFEETKRSLKGSCVIPRSHLKGPRGYRNIGSEFAARCLSGFFHVCHVSCGKSTRQKT